MPAINETSGVMEPTPDEILYRDVPLHRDYGSPELNAKVHAARDELPRNIGDHCYDAVIEEYGEDEVAYTKDVMVNGPLNDDHKPCLDPAIVEGISAAMKQRLVYREGYAASKLFKAEAAD